MDGSRVEAFLSHRATGARVAASTQNQALSALLFLYREVLQVDLPWSDAHLSRSIEWAVSIMHHAKAATS